MAASLSALAERDRMVDAFRVRDGYMGCNTAGDALEAVPAANPDLRIALVVYADRAPIVKGFVDGLKPEALNDVMDGGTCVSYKDYYDGDIGLVSNVDNHDPTGDSGVDALFIDFGAYDRAVLDVLFDANLPDGADWNYLDATLPMEIPSTDDAVVARFETCPRTLRTRSTTSATETTTNATLARAQQTNAAARVARYTTETRFDHQRARTKP